MINETMNSQPKVRLSKVLLMLCLSAAIVMGTMPCAPFVTTARADDTEKTIACPGADVLRGNCANAGAATVYYGKHDNSGQSDALAWRVINYNGTGALFNGNENNLTLFAEKRIGDCQEFSRTSNYYSTSNLKSYIDGIYNTDFTETEKSAIKKRELYSGSYDGIVTDCIGGDPLTGDAAPNLWPLSAKEANEIYWQVYNKADNYLHDDEDWWLRSPGKEKIVSGMDYNVNWNKIDFDPGDASAVVYQGNGVRPAFNIGLDSIISTSLISGTKGEPGAEYKLTILDSDLSVSINNVSKSNNNTFTVGYTITDNSSIDPTQLSVLITDGHTTWTDNGWSCSQSGENISYLQYTKLGVENFGLSGTGTSGTFTLDSSITGTLGEDYHVYILAEDVNGGHETDYASPPMEILAPSAVRASAKNQEFTYDGKPHGISVNIIYPKNGVTVTYGESTGNYTSNTSPTITNVSESPKTIYYKAEAGGFTTAAGSATVTINKAKSAITKAPSAISDLKYTGQAQALVNAGTATGGRLYYAVTTENTAPAGSAYTAAVPKKTDAGTYFVWYKVTGDANHKDIDPEHVSVHIEGEEEKREAHKPVLIKATSDAISVEVEEGVEYSVDGGNNWNRTGIFTGLQSDKEYSVIARYAASGGKEAGEPSEALKVRTLKIVEKPVSTKTLKVSDNEIQVNTVLSSEENSGGEGYSVGQVEIPDDVALSLFNGLSEEEQKRVANGAKFTVTFSVKESVIDLENLENKKIKDNKEKADKKIKEITGGTVEAAGVMLDMGLFVQVGNDEKKETEPSKGLGKITFTVTVPVDMKNTDSSIIRTFYLIHFRDDGTVEIVNSGTEAEIPAETDSFSYWYLTYVDEKKDDGGNSGNPSKEKVITVSDNQPMAYSEETKGEFRIGYFHEIPFFGKAKPDLRLFGDITVSCNGATYKATKIKVNKKKGLIRITGLDTADKDIVKAVKKATKGSNGLSFKVNPYYVKDTDTVTPKFKKDGSLKSIKVKICEKDYKAKKDEFSYDQTTKIVSFSGSNLNGSCRLR